MVTTKGEFIFIDEELTRVRVSMDPDTVKVTLETPIGWQSVMTFRRSDPDLRALVDALLGCCEEDGHGGA